MKSVLALIALGALAPMVQGVAGTLVPPRFCPDLSMLLALGLGVSWRSTAGAAVLVVLLGFVADLLSGSLFGHHALLRLLAFGAARRVSQQLNLRGVFAQMIFAFAFTGVNAVAGALLTSFFAAGPGVDVAMLRELVPHAVVNGLLAPVVVALVERLAAALEDGGGRLQLTIPPRGAS